MQLQCCGVDSYTDYWRFANKSIPFSCCGNKENVPCNTDDVRDKQGCATALQNFFKFAGTALGGIALGIAAVEVSRHARNCKGSSKVGKIIVTKMK